MDGNAEKRPFFILLLIVGLAAFFAFTGRDSRAAPSNTDLITTTPLDKLAWEIQIYQEYLQRTDLPDEMKWGFQRKIEVLQLEQTQEALSRINTPILPETFNKTPIVLDFGPLPTGMIEKFPVPSSLNFVVEEGWQDYVSGEYVTFGAGYMANDPEQGAIIYSNSGDPFVVVKTSKKSGELKIKGVKGKKIVLLSKTGETFYFDVPGRKFISTLDDVAATVTPSDQEKVKLQEPTPTVVPAYPFPQP